MNEYPQKLVMPVTRVVHFRDGETVPDTVGECIVTPWANDQGVDFCIHNGSYSYCGSVSHDAAQALSQALKNTRRINTP